MVTKVEVRALVSSPCPLEQDEKVQDFQGLGVESMGRGYVNAGIPPGMVRDIRALLADETLGYKNMAEVVKDGTRVWLVLLKFAGSMNGIARRGPEKEAGRRA